MTKVIPWIVVALVLAFAISRRLRGGRAATPPWQRVRSRRPEPRAGVGTAERLFGVVGLVAAREIRQRVRGRVFRVATLVILAGIAAAIIIPAVHKSKAQILQVGVVGTVSSPVQQAIETTAAGLGATAHVVTEASQTSANSALRSGKLDVVIVGTARIIVNKPIEKKDASAKAQFVRSMAKTLGVFHAFGVAGLSPSQVTEVVNAKPLPVGSLQPPKQGGAVKTTSVIGIIVLFIMLTQYNTWTLVGVMEEKSSRVVEVLLAAVRPIQLLAGKVIGIGTIVFAQAALIVGFAFALGGAVGSDLLKGSTPLTLVATLVWLVAGYAFYCWIYAAIGSMAERQDQVQALAVPVSLPMVLGYVMAITVASSGSSSTFFDVLAYIPLTAPFAMPVLVGIGAVAWWQFAISLAISIVSTVAMARLAAAVYRRAVLRTGRRVRLREALAIGA
jgi:ABC-2 type transport system permease protein